MGYALILLFLIIGIVAAVFYSLKRKLAHFVFAMKVLHISAISISAISVFLVENEILVYIVGACLPLLFLLVYKGYFNGKEHQNRSSWGVFYFAAVFFVLLLAFPEQPKNIFYPLIVLALADGMATLLGYFFGKHPLSFSNEPKSWEGSIAFFISTWVCFQLIPQIPGMVDPGFHSIWALLIVCAFLTVVEAISVKGRDNIWVSLGVLYWMLIDTTSIDGFSFLIVLGIAVITFFTFKMKWLTPDGAVAAAIMGCVLLISPQPKWVIPALVFFVVGSSISFFPGKEIKQGHEPRSSFQVFCNGGVSTFFMALLFITSDFVFLIAGIAALATSMSDTTSSEIGVRYGKKTYNIYTFRSVSAGLSGGISAVGTIAGIAILALYSLIPFAIIGEFNLKVYLIIVSSGLFGNIMDSYLGALFQIKYRSPSSAQWSDYPGKSAGQESRGYPIITNDVVNLLSTILASLLGVFLYNVL